MNESMNSNHNDKLLNLLTIRILFSSSFKIQLQVFMCLNKKKFRSFVLVEALSGLFIGGEGLR